MTSIMVKQKKVFKEAVHFINSIEKISQKLPSEIYSILGVSRQTYSQLKNGLIPLTNNTQKKVALKLQKLGVTKDNYKKICTECLSYII